MLQLRDIRKKYTTGELTQSALDGVSFNLRDSEFVAVLGPSGSGKTTLLNVVGGLDRYDSGDLIINGVSTRRYRDRDWDSYRNHTIGFVFQSYNLIPHQSVLSNVELALTISGIGKSERKRRAREALEKVGLGDQTHKKPNQMSGGQMQRVAIARALVNDPDILLADEPTGALDSETSVQVMELLSEVAKDRLVVMVTHNAELAEKYATRTIRLRDGKIVGDSDPFEVDDSKLAPPEHRNMGRASMSFLTALSLSFNNLRTKKGRTILTAFAGSIGIIGIALILSLSNGVNTYITDIQKSTMLSYPITIEAKSIDLSSLIAVGREKNGVREINHELDAVYSDPTDIEMVSSVTASITENDLTAFKKYLDDPASEIRKYLGENSVAYSYKVNFDVYAFDPDGELVNTDGSTLTEGRGQSFGMMSGMAMGGSSSEFKELLPGADGAPVSRAVTENYELLYGSWPEKYDETVLILNSNNEISASDLYKLGLLPSAEYKDIMKKIGKGEEVKLDGQSWSYPAVCGKCFYMIPACDYYVKNADGSFSSVEEDKEKLAALTDSCVKLRLTGVIRAKDDTSASNVRGSVGYTSALTDYILGHTDGSAVVTAQRSSIDTNVINGMAFAPSDDAAKLADSKKYIASLNVSEKAKLASGIMKSAYAANPEAAGRFAAMSETELAASFDEYMKAPEDEALLAIYESYISPGSYDDNMSEFGVVSLDAPSSINIYADSFEDKDRISDCISDYNSAASEEDRISYTDYVGLLMSSVTTIVNVISYVLIAFVAVSLVVSSIMIGIITFISVLERTKEIGILRAIGASKHNISQVFNAETFIIGLMSGFIGVGVTLLLLIPGNAVIHALTGSTDVNAALPAAGAVILILLSMALTLIAGLIPSRKAAKKDPVASLRSE